MVFTKKIRFACLVLATIFLCSCTGQSASTLENTDTTVQKGEEILETLKLNIESFKADKDKYTAKLAFDRDFSGQVTVLLKSEANSQEDKKDISAKGGESFEITASAPQFCNGDFSLIVSAEGTDMQDSASVKFKNGLPQLSVDSVKLVADEMTLQEKASLFVAMGAERNMAATTYVVERLGLPTIHMADGPAGLRIDTPTVGYPSGTNLANTWDGELVKKITSYMGDDCKSYGVDVLLSPGLNIQKNILGGRNFEYFSEDPYLTGMMAASYTSGLQSTGVGACLKHYAANNQESNRGSYSAQVTERALREIYLKAFDYAVDISSPYTVMTSYNRIAGTYTSTMKDLICDILKDEFAFDGFVMSDWGAGGGKDEMIHAGNDMYCGSPDVAKDVEAVVDMVRSRKIKMEDLDRCCENILSVIAKTNAMTQRRPEYEVQNKEEKLQAVRSVGAESMVLLKNDTQTLPLSNDNKEIALFGNASYVTEHCGYGAGYVVVDHVVHVKEGLENASFTINPKIAALYDGCKRHPHVLTQEANPINDEFEIVLDERTVKRSASESDYAIFTISRMTMEGADHADCKGDFSLNDRERNAIKIISDAFHAEGKKFIVLINTGNPIEVKSWADMADAIVYIGLSGEQIGNSTADILTGAVNPSGKLACTWPITYGDTACSEYFPGNSEISTYYDDIYVGYRYYTTFDIDTAYEFGYGLSYTQFEYSDFQVSENSGKYTLSVKVTNIGSVSGRETAQFYVSKPDGKNEHPVIELVGYAKTPILNAGEDAVVSVNVTEKELMTYFTADSKWIVEKGEYTFSVGASVEDIKSSTKITINEEIQVRDVENACTPVNDFEIITKDNPKSTISGENLALNKTVYVSGEEAGYLAEYAVDGSYHTRWSALGTTENFYWITVDLGKITDIDRVVIRWESNTEGEFSVMTSNDNVTWKRAKMCKYEAINNIQLDTSARYVKIMNKATGFFSIYSIEIF